MDYLNLLATKSNYQLMAENLLGVQNIELKETPVSERFANIGAELAIGVPATGALVTAPYWGKPLLKPYKAFFEMRANPNLNYFQAWKNLSENRKALTAHLTENQSFWQRKQNLYNYNKINSWAKELPTFRSTDKIKNPQKALNTLRAQNCYAEADRLLKESIGMKGNELKQQTRKIIDAIAKGDAEVNKLVANGTIKPTSAIGKVGHYLKGKTGYYTAKGALLSTTRGASALRLASKCAKGSGIMAVIGGLLEIPNLISANEADKAEAANGKASSHLKKQAVKSTVKVGAGVLGYAAGAAATGAIIGSVCPGIGNAAGAIIGFVGGAIGAALFGWGADKVVGEKTEAEEYTAKADAENKAKAEQLAKEVETNPETKNELLAAIYEKYEKGEIDNQEVIAALNNELIGRNEIINSIPSDNQSQLALNTSTDNDYNTLIDELRTLQTPNNLYYAA